MNTYSSSSEAEAPPECCYYDEQRQVMCPRQADYTTYFKSIHVAFCEAHYREWIVLPLLDGTLEPAMVSRFAPGGMWG